MSWDPSSYDIETLVAIVFSAQCGLAGYLPIQNIKPVLKSEVDPSILALSAINKLTRVEGYNEIRALSHALKAINWPLEKFIFPEDLLWRQLEDFEERIWEDGRFWVVNTRTQEKRLQIPPNFQIRSTPLLVSMSDQGGINRAGLDYLLYKLSLAIHVQFDPYHRGWNDVKQSLKNSKGDLFKCFLSFALLYNVNYGPSGSKEWFMRKQGLAQDIISSASAHEEPWLSFVPWVCKERNIAEPQSSEEREQLFNTIINMNSVRALGPVVKLMRWYSWWESEKYFEGECWATKFVMLWKTKNCSPTNVANFVRPEDAVTIPSKGLTDKQELQQLKKQHGTWALAPLLITPASMFQKDIIKLIAQPSWTHHANRSKNILTTNQVACLTVEKCKGGWVDELYDLVIQGFLSPAVMKQLYPHQATSESTKKKRLEVHLDFLTKLLAKRSMSLAAQYLRPPIRYCPMWSTSQKDQANILETKEKMQEDWQAILELEKRYCMGEHIPGMEAMHFLKESITRVCFLLNEQDLINGTADAQVIMQCLINHVGCTSVIENTHQSAKDTLRQARHNQRSGVHKFKACIDAKILQSRQIDHVSISEVELALARAQNLPQVLHLTHPNSHKMKKGVSAPDASQVRISLVAQHFCCVPI